MRSRPATAREGHDDRSTGTSNDVLAKSEGMSCHPGILSDLSAANGWILQTSGKMLPAESGVNSYPEKNSQKVARNVVMDGLHVLSV